MSGMYERAAPDSFSCAENAQLCVADQQVVGTNQQAAKFLVSIQQLVHDSKRPHGFTRFRVTRNLRPQPKSRGQAEDKGAHNGILTHRGKPFDKCGPAFRVHLPM